MVSIAGTNPHPACRKRIHSDQSQPNRTVHDAFSGSSINQAGISSSSVTVLGLGVLAQAAVEMDLRKWVSAIL